MEEFKPITNFENYEVSNFGNVKNIKTGKILKSCANGRGYLQVVLYTKNGKFNKRINRLVAETFLKNPDNKPVVDHIDRNVLNNNVLNLRWATNSENAANSGTYILNKLGIKGIRKKKYGSYEVNICINGIKIFKNFKDLETAILWRKNKKKELFGIFADD